VDDQLQPIQQQYMQDSTDPDYAKPTIAKKLKDHEIARIADAKRQTEKVKTVISSHNEMLRSERLNPDRYTKRGFASVKHTEVASAKVLSQSLKKKAQRSGDQTMEQPP